MNSGGTPDKSNRAYWNGTIPWLSSGDIKGTRIAESSERITEAGLDSSSARLCRPNSVLVVVRSGILKHTLPVATLEIEAAINQDIKCLDSGYDFLNRWLALALGANANKLIALNREGTTVQSVKSETLNSFVLSIPPASEQHRIVAKLDALLTRVNACRQRLDKIPKRLARFRQSVLAAACSGSTRSVPVSELLQIPLSNGRSVQDATTGGFPVLRLTCIRNGEIDISQRKLGKWTEAEASKYSVQQGDFLVARGNGSLSRVGKGGYVREQPDEVAFPDTLIRIRVDSVIVEPKFFTLVWQSALVRTQIEQRARTSAGIWKISQRDIEKFEIPLPSLPEQQEIVRRVDQLFAFADRLEARVETARKRVEALTQSILAKAFRGELVPTEAELARAEGRAYESAAQLLERIAGLNAKTTDKPRRKPRKQK